jgi:hypothetical protein
MQQETVGGAEICLGAAVIADKTIEAGARIAVSYTGGTTMEEEGWDRIFKCKCCACASAQMSGGEVGLCCSEPEMTKRAVDGHYGSPTHRRGAAVLFPEHILKTWPVEGERRAECVTNRPGQRGRKEAMQPHKG